MKDFPPFLKDLDPTIYLRGEPLFVDFETTNKDKGSALNELNYIVCAVWTFRGTTKRASGDYGALLSDVQSAGFIVAHNAKFELQWLYRLGIEAGTILCYDTLLGRYVQNGNLKTPLDLNSVAGAHGLGQKDGYVSKLIKAGVCPSEIPMGRLLDYCEQDVRLTEEVFYRQREELRLENLLPTLFTRCLTTMVLADVEAKGMWVDGAAVRKEYHAVAEQARVLMADIHEMTGGINPKSPKQVAEYLYDKLGFEELTDYKGEPIRTPTGGRKAGEDVVMALKATTPEQEAFAKLIRAYIPLKMQLQVLTKLNDCANGKGPLFAQFNQSVTGTHRLSSSGKQFKVQFQNIDRDFKRLFMARNEGWVIGSADGRQLEFRVAAHLGRDPQALADAVNNFDVHRFTASVLNKVPPEKVTKKQRTDAKPYTFKPLYGGTSGTPDERRYYKAFQKKYKVLYSRQRDWTYEVLKNKSLLTETGLRFYWPDCQMYESGYIKGTTEIFNYPVQSLATAEIIPISLVYLWYRMKINGLQSFIVNTVHDSVVSEIAPGEEEVWKECLKEAFTGDTFRYLAAVYNIQFTVPLGVAFNSATHWDQGDEEEFDVNPGTFSG